MHDPNLKNRQKEYLRRKAEERMPCAGCKEPVSKLDCHPELNLLEGANTFTCPHCKTELAYQIMLIGGDAFWSRATRL